jgi:hypothetical protein
MTTLHHCQGCGGSFEPSRFDSIYCTPACRQKAYRQRVTDARNHNGVKRRNKTLVGVLDRTIDHLCGACEMAEDVEMPRLTDEQKAEFRQRLLVAQQSIRRLSARVARAKLS